MKKVAYAVLILTMAIFLITQLSLEARGGYGGGHGGGYGGGHSGGYGGGHGGGYGGWWVPWAILGGAALAAPYYYSPYYAPYYSPYYYAPPPVIIREQPPVNVQPAPSLPPLSSERLFAYPRENQSEERQVKDRNECQSWAASQTGYEPTKSPAGDMPEAQRNQIRADYQRAQSACLEGRGYTVR
jgi:hypothetical protein